MSVGRRAVAQNLFESDYIAVKNRRYHGRSPAAAFCAISS